MNDRGPHLYCSKVTIKQIVIAKIVHNYVALALLQGRTWGSGSSPFPFEMKRVQYTDKIALKIINAHKRATSFKMLKHS